VVYPRFFIPRLLMFLLFIEQNLFSVLVPSVYMYVHQLSGIPIKNNIRDLQSCYTFKRHLKHISFISPPSEPLNTP